jgi:peptidoglycan LD-endopeptidase CwlK
MASRSLDDLSPACRARAVDFIARAKLAGLDLLVTCTLRNRSEQRELWAQGRTKPGLVVTWATPGTSWHEGGGEGADALDVVPLRNGKPVWGTTGPDLLLWQQVGAIGEACGLQWAGRWPAKIREFPHFQYRDIKNEKSNEARSA